MQVFVKEEMSRVSLKEFLMGSLELGGRPRSVIGFFLLIPFNVKTNHFLFRFFFIPLYILYVFVKAWPQKIVLKNLS
jgi:hypothetical protein